MNMLRASKLKKQLQQLIIQGNQREIQKLFDSIVKVTRDEFTESNLATLSSFLVENLYRAFDAKNPAVRKAMKGSMIATLDKVDEDLLEKERIRLKVRYDHTTCPKSDTWFADGGRCGIGHCCKECAVTRGWKQATSP